MILLEKLYDCAGDRLSGDLQHWQKFAGEFEAIARSKMALYRLPGGMEGLKVTSDADLIATTSPETISKYFKLRIFEFDPIFNVPANPFEPLRRSEHMGDEEFREQEVVRKFFLPNNIFYLMVLYAVLPDASFLVLLLWRDEASEDFSDLEKQRLALFMRFLNGFVRVDGPVPVRSAHEDLKLFGEKHLLTDAEIGVLEALLEGRSLRAIAEESERSYTTVRWHVQNLLEKCQVKTQKNLLNEFYGLIKS